MKSLHLAVIASILFATTQIYTNNFLKSMELDVESILAGKKSSDDPVVLQHALETKHTQANAQAAQAEEQTKVVSQEHRDEQVHAAITKQAELAKLKSLAQDAAFEVKKRKHLLALKKSQAKKDAATAARLARQAKIAADEAKRNEEKTEVQKQEVLKATDKFNTQAKLTTKKRKEQARKLLEQAGLLTKAPVAA